MKIDKNTRVAVDIRNCSDKQKEAVCIAMENITGDHCRSGARHDYLIMVGDRGMVKYYSNGNPHNYPVVTFAEFMESINSDKEPSEIRPDAYIDGQGFVYIWKDGYISPGHLSTAYTYNLMKEEDFMAKHKRTLKLGEWEIKLATPEPGFTKVGCQVVKNEAIEGFYQVMDILRIHDENGENIPQPWKVYDFIVKYRKDLKL